MIMKRRNLTLIAALLLVVMAAVFVFVGCEETVQTYTLTLDGGESLVSSVNDVTVVQTAPEAPVKDGYRFEKWYLDKEFTKEAVFPLVLTEDTTLYAKWTKLYTVTYVTNGGTEVESYTGTVVEQTPVTYKDGFFFAGWYTNPKFTGKAVTFPYTLKADSSLYAKWTKDEAEAEYKEISEYRAVSASFKAVKEYFLAMNGSAIDIDTVLTTNAGTARIQFVANMPEGESAQIMFKVTMQDGGTGFAMYVKDDELYFDFGGDTPVIHVDDVRADYLLAILQKGGAQIDLEEILGNVGGLPLYDLLLALILDPPMYEATQRISTGELLYESYTFEVKVNNLVSGINELLGMFDLGQLIGVDLNLTPLFDWLNSVIPQVKMYWKVECQSGIITAMQVFINDNAQNAGDELVNWKTENIGFYDYPLYVEIPSDIADNAKEFSLSNLKFDIDLNLQTPEEGLDIAKLIAIFTDKVNLPADTLILQSKFGFRLKAKVDLDLNYANANVDKNLIALELYKLGADGKEVGDALLGIFYRDGAAYVSLANLMPDYWKADNIKVEANLDALISDLVKLVTDAIDKALGTEWQASELALSSGNVINATLSEGEDGQVNPVISPTISGLITAVASVIGLQENIFVNETGDAVIVEVNQKFFDAINTFLPNNKITLPEGIEDLKLVINCFEGGIKSVDAGVAIAGTQIGLTAHNFMIGFAEYGDDLGGHADLESYIASKIQDANYSSNLGEIIFGLMKGVELNANAKISLEQGNYALGKILKGLGLDTGNNNPVFGISEAYALDAAMLAAVSIDESNPANSKFAIELSAKNSEGTSEVIFGLYAYYDENGEGTVLLDLSKINVSGKNLPVYKFKLDFANIIIDLIKGIKIGDSSLTDFDLAFDLSGLLGGSDEAASALMMSTDGTAEGTELTEEGKILIGLNADKITANVTLAAVLKLLQSLNVDIGVDLSSLDVALGVEIADDITVSVDGNLPKEGENEYGLLNVTLTTGSDEYPLMIGETANLDAAIERAKIAAEQGQDDLYDIVFDMLNSYQGSIEINLTNVKESIDVAAMINRILAQEGQYLPFPINLNFDANTANLYLDAKWDIDLETPKNTKIYLELRYESKKVFSIGVKGGDVYFDLEGLGLFEFKVVNSNLATSLLTMLNDMAGQLHDIDLGQIITDLIVGAQTATVEEGGAEELPGAPSQEDKTKAVLSAVLGGLSIYDGVIGLNLSAQAFDAIFSALLGAPLGIKLAIEDAKLDIANGTVSIPVVIEETVDLSLSLTLSQATEFDVTNESGKVLDSTDGTAMAKSLLNALDIDFNFDIASRNIDTSGSDTYLRINIKKITGGAYTLPNTKSSLTGGDPQVAPDGSILVTIKYLDGSAFYTDANAGSPFAYIVMDIMAEKPTMAIHFATGQLTAKIIGISIDLAGMIPLSFDFDLVGMLAGAMQSIIDAVDFGAGDVTAAGGDETVEEEVPSEQPAEEPAQPGLFDGIDILELLSGGINLTLRSTGTLSVDVSLDPYLINKLIDDILGGYVFGPNSQIDLSQMQMEGMSFSDHYLSHVIWDRMNPTVFWESLKEQLTPLIKDAAAGQEVPVIGDVSGLINEDLLSTVYSNIYNNVLKRLLPLPLFNEMHAGLEIVDGTVANLYIRGYDRNQDIVSADGELLTYHYEGINGNGQSVSGDLEYSTSIMNRSTSFKTEINVYNRFASVGDPSNTPDGSGNAGIVNWGDVQLDLVFEPYEYPDDNQKAYEQFYNTYFNEKKAVYQQGQTVIRGNVQFLIEVSEGVYEEVSISNLNLLQIAKNENAETTVMKGKARVDFGNGIIREEAFSITVYPVSSIGMIEPIQLHVYDGAPSKITVHFTNKSTRHIQTSTVAGIKYEPTGVEGGSSTMDIKFANGAVGTVEVNYLNSYITTIGNNGEEGVYEYNLYDITSALDVVAMLPEALFFSYEDGVYSVLRVDEWIVDNSVIEQIKQKQPSDLGAIEFKAIAVVAKDNEAITQNVEITVRFKTKQVESLGINGVENTLVINPYDYYLYLTDTSENKGTFPVYPSEVVANYNENGVKYNEKVPVQFTTDFDYSKIGYNTDNDGKANVSLDESKFGGYFDWTKEITIDVQTNVISGVFFDKKMTVSDISVDPGVFNTLSAQEKAMYFPSTAYFLFDNGYKMQLPVRWTDRNGFPVDIATLTFDYENEVKRMYVEIGFEGDDSVKAAFYQRAEVSVTVKGALAYMGEAVTVDAYGEAGSAQFPSTIKVGNNNYSYDVNVTEWNVSAVDFSAKGGEYAAIAKFTIGSKEYSVVVPVIVKAKSVASLDNATVGVVIGADGALTADVNGTQAALAQQKVIETDIEVTFDDQTKATLKVKFDFTAVNAEGAVFYYPALGTIAEEQGATAFDVTATYSDASGKGYVYGTVKVYITDNSPLAYEGEGVTVDAYGETGSAQFPSQIQVKTGAVGYTVDVTEWDVSGVVFTAEGGSYTATAKFAVGEAQLSVQVPVTVKANKVASVNEFEGLVVKYSEAEAKYAVTIGETEFDVTTEKTVSTSVNAVMTDETVKTLNVTIDFSSVVKGEETVLYDPSLGTSAEEQGATAFTVVMTYSDAQGNAYTFNATVYLSLNAETEQPQQ